MRFSRRIFLPLAVGLLVLPPAGTARGAAALPLERWREFMETTHVPGMAVAVVRDTGIVAMATLGLRDVERGLPVTPRTRFYVASCTKPIVATAVWGLAGEGRLDLDAPVRNYYPAFRLPDAALADSISLRDLMSHRMGLVCRPLSYATAHTGQMTDTTFDRLLAQRTRIRGEYGYSNIHYLVCGRVLEERLGRPWQQVVEERVLAPAGMTRSTARASVLYADADVALPYAFTEGRLVAARAKTDRTMHAAGGVGGSLEDFCRWVRLQLGEGAIDGRRVFPRAMMAGMRERVVEVFDRHPLRPDWTRTGATAGWEMRVLGTDSMLVHTGNYVGTATHFSFAPRLGLGVVVLCNGEAPPLSELVAAEAYDWALQRESPDSRETLARIMSRMFPPPAPDSARGRLTRDPRAYAGRFAHADWGMVEVTARDQALAMRQGDLPLPLRYTGDDRFLADGETPGQFELDAKGRVVAVWLRMDRADSARFVRR